MVKLNNKNYKRVIAHNVELQKDFFAEDGKLTLNNPMTPARVQEFYDKAPEESFDEVIFATDNHIDGVYEKTEEYLDKGFPKHCIYGTEGWEFMLDVEPIKAKHNVFFIGKDTNDVWLGKDDSGYLQNDEDFKSDDEALLYDELFYIKKGVEAGAEVVAENIESFLGDLNETVVVLTGGATDICVKMAAGGYLKRGADVVIAEDLVKGLFQEAPEVIVELQEEFGSGKIVAMDSNDILDDIIFSREEEKLGLQFNKNNEIQNG